jgi:two-component system C4-dicarboxylate transport sensor histidine kinase DctB
MHNWAMFNALSAPLNLADLDQSMRRTWLVFAGLAVALLVAALLLAGEYGRSQALETVDAQSRIDANLKASLLRAVLERQRSTPLVLADDVEVMAALSTRGTEALQRLNEKLQALATNTDAAVIYVIGPDGVAVAASNWREPTSFVGNDYAFREYFRMAMRDGKAEHFAMGNVSKRPGLYISRRVQGPDGPIGVVVAKLEFDDVEAEWLASGKPVYVTDRRGIVLITSFPSWRFMTTRTIPRDRVAAIRDSLQFGDASLLPLPFRDIEPTSDGSSELRALLPGESERRFLRVETMVPTTSWRLEQLAPLDGAISAATREARLIALALLAPLLAFTAVQQELVQANRLAILGQVAAGVAHEINQPVATIRAYADNARTFLERGQQQTAVENLVSIAELTDRVGTITDELRSFARKGRFVAEPTPMRDVIEGAMMLLRSRFAGRMDAIVIDLPENGLSVLGSHIRLEQVLINLLQNALEALGTRSDAEIRVRCKDSPSGTVLLVVADNGPGIPLHIHEDLFTPFNTSKDEGLGLGLAISKEIVADYGGDITVETSDRGTVFTVRLKRA